ncbi:hypothetical protein GHT06_007665 [Daphnia sinensis]|uniref:Uncharacterized protein n=1 Tax=Daphnia sinensis TaxID=1820382 RepID=A0AAD5L4V2_9CRUS|nr:hypothetical protein GHT06_007665 [Daphnia sinensis]
MQVRGTWKGAPKVKIIALESEHIAHTGPYVASQFARQLWFQNEKIADDRFENEHQEEPVGILVGMDQMFQIMLNEPAIQSPFGLRAYNTHLGRMLAGPSKETNCKMGQRIIQQIISRQLLIAREYLAKLDGAQAVEPKDHLSSFKTKSLVYQMAVIVLRYHGQRINGDYVETSSWPREG